MKETLETIIYEKKDGYAIVTMNRPDKLNACNTTMYKEMSKTLAKIDVDPDIHAVIITGSGEKAFSAGADIEEHNMKTFKESREYIGIDATAFRYMENIRQPVIAAVNGAAIGYGCKVAIISDIVIASQKARFSLPGATFGAVHVITLGRGLDVLGRTRLAYMLLTGEIIDATQAERYGIVTKVVAPDQVLPEAEKTAAKIAAFPPLSMEYTRRMLHRGCDDDYRWEDLLSPGLMLNEALIENRRRFLEKRKGK